MHFTVYGNPITKKNNMRVGRNRYTGKIYVSQSKQYNEYEKLFLNQIRGHSQPIKHEVNLKCIYFMATHQKVDLTNLLSASNDCLVKAGILADDNSNIVVGMDGSRVYYDKDNPRVEIEITTV